MSGEILSPPDGWTELPGDAVMTNADRTIEEAIADRLREGGCFSRHAAWDFNGVVWHDGGRWYEQVSVHRQPRGAFSADTLEDLMRAVNDEFGWA